MEKREVEERNKASKLTKIFGGIAIAAILVSDCGCQSTKIYEKSPTRFEKRFDEKDFMIYPEHIKGTIMDPYPPARRGY